MVAGADPAGGDRRRLPDPEHLLARGRALHRQPGRAWGDEPRWPAGVPEDELRILIRPSGYMVRKAAAIKAFVSFLDREHGSSLARLAEQPTEHGPPPTAGTCPAWERKPPMPFCSTRCSIPCRWWTSIAPHCHRHGLAGRNRKYGEVQQLVDAAFAHDPAEFRLQLFNEFHALVVAVGKHHCGPTPAVKAVPWPCSLMARTLYIASTNPGKLRDFSLAAAGQHWILPLPGLNAIEAPAEDGLTFADNAREKAIYYSRFYPAKWSWPTIPDWRSIFSRALPVFAPPATPPMPASTQPALRTPTTIFSCYSSSPGLLRATAAPVIAVRWPPPRMELFAWQAGHGRRPHPHRSAGQRGFRIRSTLLSACSRLHHGGDGRSDQMDAQPSRPSFSCLIATAALNRL